MSSFLRQLEQSGLTKSEVIADAELLGRFLRSGDEEAFALLVHRHGPMVFRVCRSVSGHPQDAEDAFQATFLVLARKAHRIHSAPFLGNWLYGVALKVARRARRTAARRRVREIQVPDFPEPISQASSEFSDILPLLYEELARLPGHYRESIVLCDLRGISRTEAAKQLDIPEGTLSSRLGSGRKRLADRLARRGVALSAAAVPTALAIETASATLPQTLLTNTRELASRWAAGEFVPPILLHLAQGGFSMRSMALVVLLGAAITTSGIALTSQAEDSPAPRELPGVQDRAVVVKQQPQEVKPAAKEDDKPAPVQKARALKNAFDLPITGVSDAKWSPDGKGLAVLTEREDNRTNDNALWIVTDVFENDIETKAFSLSKPRDLVGFSSAGEQIILARREYALLSGIHRLEFFDLKAMKSTPASGKIGLPDGSQEVRVQPRSMQPAKTVNLDGASQAVGYATSRDAITFRTISRTVLGKKTNTLASLYEDVEIREISSIDGQSRTLLKIPETVKSFSLSPNGGRFAALNEQGDSLEVWDVNRGAKLWVTKIPSVPPRNISFATPNAQTWTSTITSFMNHATFEDTLCFSNDGSRLVFFRGNGPALSYLTEKGELLPSLENSEICFVNGEFTGDGRFLAACGRRPIARPISAKKKGAQGGAGERGAGDKAEFPQANSSTLGPESVTIWDTTTGKRFRLWQSTTDSRIVVAVHPTKPIVAILEPNGAQVRVGLWDFSADEPMKK